MLVKLSNQYFKEIDDILLSISAYEKSQLENKLFTNNTISYINNNSSPISIKNDFFDKERFLKNCNLFVNKKNYYKGHSFIRFFSIINNSYNNKKKNYFLIFFYFIFFLILGFISYNKKVFEIYLKLKDNIKFILGNKEIIIKNNFNVIYALMYVRLILTYFKKISKIT
jgi:hypothetical protein